MIRTSSGHNAFDDLHNYFHDRQSELRSWFADAITAAAGSHISYGAALHLGRRAGRTLSDAESLAIGWCVSVLFDLMRHMDRVTASGGSREAVQMAWNDGVASLRNHYASHFTGLHPAVVSQMGVAMTHIDKMNNESSA